MATELDRSFWSADFDHTGVLLRSMGVARADEWLRLLTLCREGGASNVDVDELQRSARGTALEGWAECVLAWIAWARLERHPTLPPRGDRLAGARVAEVLTSAAIDLDQEPGATSIERVRRAWRMARSESLPLLEVSAALQLARARRLTGFVAAARYVLAAVVPLVPPILDPRAEWETTLCGLGIPLTTEPSQAVESLLHAPHAPASYVEARRAARHAGLRADVEAVLQALGHSAPDAAADSARGELPRGLAALASDPQAPVWVQSGAPSRRLLDRAITADARLGPAELPQQRTAAALAWLMQQNGVEVDETYFFAEVYGFAFDGSLHRAVLDTLLHRVRRATHGVARLERTDRRLRLVTTTTFAVWDPRGAPRSETRAAAFLGAHGVGSAREVAAELGCSLRAAHAILQQLIDDGICRTRQEGRNVRYELEDTTFSVLTRARFEMSKA